MSNKKKKSIRLTLKIKRQKNNIQAQLQSLPAAPGIYKMRNSDSVIIYIGKAKSIKARVSSYFTSKDHTLKNQKMVKQVVSIDYIVTHSENEAYREALIIAQRLENNDLAANYCRQYRDSFLGGHKPLHLPTL